MINIVINTNTGARFYAFKKAEKKTDNKKLSRNPLQQGIDFLKQQKVPILSGLLTLSGVKLLSLSKQLNQKQEKIKQDQPKEQLKQEKIQEKIKHLQQKFKKTDSSEEKIVFEAKIQELQQQLSHSRNQSNKQSEQLLELQDKSEFINKLQHLKSVEEELKTNKKALETTKNELNEAEKRNIQQAESMDKEKEAKEKLRQKILVLETKQQELQTQIQLLTNEKNQLKTENNQLQMINNIMMKFIKPTIQRLNWTSGLLKKFQESLIEKIKQNTGTLMDKKNEALQSCNESLEILIKLVETILSLKEKDQTLYDGIISILTDLNTKRLEIKLHHIERERELEKQFKEKQIISEEEKNHFKTLTESYNKDVVLPYAILIEIYVQLNVSNTKNINVDEFISVYHLLHVLLEDKDLQKHFLTDDKSDIIQQIKEGKQAFNNILGFIGFDLKKWIKNKTEQMDNIDFLK
jgi:hypothetical protein